MRNLQHREVKQFPQDPTDCKLWSLDLNSCLWVKCHTVTYIRQWRENRRMQRFNPNEWIADGEISGISEGRRRDVRVPQDVAGHSASRAQGPAEHLAYVLARVQARFVILSDLKGWNISGFRTRKSEPWGKIPRVLLGREAIRFNWGSDIILWCLTSLKWGAKFPDLSLYSPSSLTLRPRIASVRVGCRC